MHTPVLFPVVQCHLKPVTEYSSPEYSYCPVKKCQKGIKVDDAPYHSYLDMVSVLMTSEFKDIPSAKLISQSQFIPQLKDISVGKVS